MTSRWWVLALVSLASSVTAFALFGPAPLLSAALVVVAMTFAALCFKSMRGRVALRWRITILAVVGLAAACVILLLVAAVMVPDIG